ncbi:MAG: hypothetical protein AUH11_19420 [Acidobacteria bacterium 13_2_20CM_57_17]|nr:MAG: hypothetical protein AUH11_19420 [Acidobacteria bacterium 13_2_20CM_57_17]OLE17041.1 MAG: hypothetical protein AUG83_00595 [Acidobacteria bacterium 13_1_20CM_4_57_11]
MIKQEDRIRLLDDALFRAIPESREWTRGGSPGPSDGSQYWIEVRSPLRPAAQRLSVLLRHDGDIQIEYHITAKRGSPFEVLIVLAEGREVAAIEEASLFVSDLLAERLVLASAKGLFRGGRRFLKPSSLTESRRRDFSWVTSWLGTFDWPSPA